MLLSHFSHVRLCVTPWTAAHWGYPCPWDSPGKNTGVGCHFLLQCMEVKSEVVQLCPTLSDPMDCRLPGSSVHGILQARVQGGEKFSFGLRSPQGMNMWAKYYNILSFESYISQDTLINWYPSNYMASQVMLVVKNPPANAGDARDAGSIPWSRKWQPTPVFLPIKSNGQRSLAGYSPWGSKESDTTEQLSTQ